MADYNVGNIEVGIVTKNKNVLNDIDDLITKINKLQKIDKSIKESFLSINKLANGLNKISKLNMNNIMGKIDEISVATKTINTNLGNIESPKFNETATSLNKLSNSFRQFDKLKEIDFDDISDSFIKINKSIDPFLNKLKENENTITNFSNILNNIKYKNLSNANKEIKNIGKNSEKASKSISKMFSLAKIYWFFNYSKRLLGVLGKIIIASIDFEETLNKFQVSFAKYSDEAEKFANKLTYSFNLSRQSIYDYMSTFNSMLKSLGGLGTDETYELSKTLTQLALDYSSLFNVSVDSAMKSFQSVLSGQIRSIRSVSGIDVSENTIFQYYQELGGTKTMRQLSQLEKRLLRIYALEKQMDSLGAVGDLEKTINSTSNVLKQISETIHELSVYLGNIAQKFVAPFLKYFLAVMLTLKDISKAFSETIGAVTKEYPNDNKNGLFGEIEEDAENAEEAIKSLNNLLSFDKFESLQKSNKSIIGDSSDLELITNSIKQISGDMNNIKSASREIADNMLSWLGYRYDENQGGWVLKNGYRNITLIKDAILSLIALGITALVKKLTISLIALFTSVGNGNQILLTLNKTLSSILIFSIINFIINFDKLSERAKILNSVIIILTGTILIFKNRVALLSIFDKAILWLTKFNIVITATQLKILACVGAIGVIIGLFHIFNQFDNKGKKIAGVFLLLTSAVLTFVTALVIMKTTLTIALPLMAVTAAAYIASIKLLINSVPKAPKIEAKANGGFVNKGQMFIANEKGPELVGNIGGRTAVANNDMIVNAIENASYRGMNKAINEMRYNDMNIKVSFDGNNINNSAFVRAIMPAFKAEVKRTGGR